MQKPNKEFTVYFNGKMTVEAQSESEATERVYDILNGMPPSPKFTISSTEEGECVECGGTGEVTVDEQVYPGEPHTAPIGTRKCLCKAEENDDYE